MRSVPPSPEHVAAWRADFEYDTRTILRPRPRLLLSAWAEQYRQLSGGSAERGPWRNRRVPYLVEIMDAVVDPLVEDITVMKPSRVGFTEAVLINAIGYYMHQDPSRSWWRCRRSTTPRSSRRQARA
jgi:phage terminase large subunit GpA-like protein